MTDLLPMLMPSLANALLHFLWQGALIGLLAALALALLRNARPQSRYAVACAALLACVAAPVATLLHSLLAATDAPPAAVAAFAANADAVLPSTDAAASRALPMPATDLQPWIVALWAVGVGLLSLRMAFGLAWVRRLCRDAHGADNDWQVHVDRLALRLGIARKVALRLTDDGDSPVAAGWWRPVVLLPAAIAAGMPADLVEALIAHELAHVRRHDYLVNLLQGAVEALLFYHPVVWWLSRRIRIERELVADDLAAAALGEPRRLALALSELDRHAAARSPAPALPSHYAPAAHGGHLMSRIRQLVRPERRAIGSAVALPLIGLAVAGVAFYAQARFAPPAHVPAQAMPAPVAAVQAAPAPAPAPAATPAAAGHARPAPAPRPVARTAATPGGERERSGYALVRKDRDGFSMSGNIDDADDIRAARDSIDGDFLWFRRDGKAWVVRDAETLARARQAWAATDALGEQMQALDARMKPHSERMQALGARMEALGKDNAFDSPEARAATANMEALGRQIQTLAGRQVALAGRMHGATEAERARLEREQEAIAREQEAPSRQMARHGATLEAAGKRMEAQHAPMEALAREMEAASKPMEAVGAEMEALGKRIEREAGLADAQLRKLIDAAYVGGRAQPAPTRQ